MKAVEIGIYRSFTSIDINCRHLVQQNDIDFHIFKSAAGYCCYQ